MQVKQLYKNSTWFSKPQKNQNETPIEPKNEPKIPPTAKVTPTVRPVLPTIVIDPGTPKLPIKEINYDQLDSKEVKDAQKMPEKPEILPKETKQTENPVPHIQGLTISINEFY